MKLFLTSTVLLLLTINIFAKDNKMNIKKLVVSGNLSVTISPKEIISNKNMIVEVEDEVLTIRGESSSTIVIGDKVGGTVIMGDKVVTGGNTISISSNNQDISITNGQVRIGGKLIEDIESEDSNETEGVKSYDLSKNHLNLKKMTLSGQAKVTFNNVDMSKLKSVRLSGQSSTTLINLDENNLNCDLSGQSNLTIKDSILEDLDISNSGQSSTTLIGVKAEDTSLETSGQSRISGSLESNSISKDSSGQSSINI